MRRSLNDMVSYESAIRRVQQNMLKETTVEQAQFSLRQCGVLDENNQVVEAYKGIVVKAATKQQKHGRK